VSAVSTTNRDRAHAILAQLAPYRDVSPEALERVRLELDALEADLRAKVLEEVEIELLTGYVNEGLADLIKRIRALRK